MNIPTALMEEVDFPPAGTACVLCKGKGHFCQADEWTAGDGEVGVCHACVDGRTCAAMIARGVTPTRRDDPFVIPMVGKVEQDANRKSVINEAKDLLRQGKNPHGIAEQVGLSVSTVESLKRELQSAGPLRTKRPEPKPPKAESLPAPTVPASAEAEQKYAVEIARATELRIGESTIFKAVQGMTLNEFAKDLLGELCDHPSTEDGYWKVQADSSIRGVRLMRLDPDVENEELPKMCGCGRPVTHMGRCSARRGPEKSKPSPNRDIPMIAVKPELQVATPVTIVTVPRDEPKPDMTLSRAFELVRAEMMAATEDLEDGGDEFTECIKLNREIIGILHDYHPAFMGASATAKRVSVYDRALEQANSELRLIDLEMGRLTIRRDALVPVRDALERGIKAERDTR